MNIRLVRNMKKYHLDTCTVKGDKTTPWYWARGRTLQNVIDITTRYPADTVQPCTTCLRDHDKTARVIK